jgi:hypothetical protein
VKLALLGLAALGAALGALLVPPQARVEVEPVAIAAVHAAPLR